MSHKYNWAPFISRFATILVTKIRFHSLYRQFDFRYKKIDNENIDDEELVYFFFILRVLGGYCFSYDNVYGLFGPR